METLIMDHPILFFDALVDYYNKELEMYQFDEKVKQYTIKRSMTSYLKDFHIGGRKKDDPSYSFKDLSKDLKHESESLTEDKIKAMEFIDEFFFAKQNLYNTHKIKTELVQYNESLRKDTNYLKAYDEIQNHFSNISKSFNLRFDILLPYKNLFELIFSCTFVGKKPETIYKFSNNLGFLIYSSIDNYLSSTNSLDCNVWTNSNIFNELKEFSGVGNVHGLVMDVNGSKETKIKRNKHQIFIKKDILFDLTLDRDIFKVGLEEEKKESGITLANSSFIANDKKRKIALLYELINTVSFLEKNQLSYLFEFNSQWFRKF